MLSFCPLCQGPIPINLTGRLINCPHCDIQLVRLDSNSSEWHELSPSEPDDE